MTVSATFNLPASKKQNKISLLNRRTYRFPVAEMVFFAMAKRQGWLDLAGQTGYRSGRNFRSVLCASERPGLRMSEQAGLTGQLPCDRRSAPALIHIEFNDDRF